MDTFLRDRRRHRGLSAADVALHLDVHPMSVLRWERRERLPGPCHVRALASTLELDPADVVGFFDVVRPSAEPSAGVRGHGLRGVRRAAGLSVRQVADLLGVLPSTVYNWESGRVRIPSQQLPTLAATLGADVSSLTRHLVAAPPLERPRTPASELRRLRRRTGLSQQEVARRVGTTRHSLGSWERGEQPPLWAVRRLAVVYGVPVPRLAEVARVAAPPMLDVRRWSPGHLPEVLVALRRWSGLTQRGVAERVGCHRTSVRGWENGRGAPVARIREDLERLYGLEPGALLAAYPRTR